MARPEPADYHRGQLAFDAAPPRWVWDPSLRVQLAGAVRVALACGADGTPRSAIEASSVVASACVSRQHDAAAGRGRVHRYLRTHRATSNVCATMPPMIRAAIYCRLSRDRAGAALDVVSQEENCRALCARRGWMVANVYADDDTGVSSAKPRPAWRRLISDVEAGAIDAVVGWHVDRLTRSSRELEDVVGLADKHGVELATVTGEIDLSDPAGRLVARMVGAAARYEAKQNAECLKQRRRLAAQARSMAGWGTRPFGYSSDRITVVDTEAAIIRQCAARALAGESLARICRDLAVSGVTTPGGKWWMPTTLRQLLVSARISGRCERIHRGSGHRMRPVIGEIVADAGWPAIISAVDSDRLRALLADSNRRNSNPANGGRDLFRAILQCGPFCELCQDGMIGRFCDGPGRHVCIHTAISDHRNLWFNTFRRLLADGVGQVVRRRVR